MFLTHLTLFFGSLVWAALLLVALFVVVAAATEIWRGACYLGYRTFADKADKAAIRERAKVRAETSS